MLESLYEFINAFIFDQSANKNKHKYKYRAFCNVGSQKEQKVL